MFECLTTEKSSNFEFVHEEKTPSSTETVLLWHHLAECNHLHRRSECGAVRGLKKWAVLRYRYPNYTADLYIKKNLPYKVSLVAPISKISMVKMFFFFHMLTSHRTCQSLDSEHQHVQLFTLTTYKMVTIRMVTKPFMITIFHGFFPNNDIRMLKWYHTRLDYMGRFALQEGLGQLFHSPCVLFRSLVHSCNDTLCVCI